MQAQCERSCSQEKHVGLRGLDKKREPSTQIVIDGTQLKFRRSLRRGSPYGHSHAAQNFRQHWG